MKLLRIFFPLIIIINIDTLFSQSLFQTDNLDFEKGRVGGDAISWVFPKSLEKLGYSAFLTDSIKHSGELSFVINNPHSPDYEATDGDNNYCTVYQTIEPYYYRNKKIKFSVFAILDTKSEKTKGEIWLLARKGKDSILLNLINTDSPILNRNWTEYSMEGIIPEQTTELRFGVLLHGSGRLFIDNVKLEIINPPDVIIQTSVKINQDYINSINSLAKVYSSIRYFSPSDEANQIDWDNYLLSVLNAKEKLKFDNQQDLIAYFLNPFNNTFKIEKQKSIEKYYSKPKSTYNTVNYAMMYKGGPNYFENDVFFGNRKNIYSTTRRREGSITQSIDLVKYDGKEIRISCDIRVDKQSPGANAQIWTRTDIIASHDYVVETSADKPVTGNKWENRILKFKLPNNVQQLKLALVFVGEGSAWFDNLKIAIYDKGKLINNINIDNNGFEEPGNLNKIKGWTIEPAVIGAGYSFTVDKVNKSTGSQSLNISSDIFNRVNFPTEGEMYSIKISDSSYVTFPVAVYTDSVNTLPMQAKKNLNIYQFAPLDIFYNYKDYHTREAVLIQIYSILRNFSITDIDVNSLDSSFKINLAKIVNTDNYDEIIQILNDFIFLSQDSKARIWNSFNNYDYGIPILFKKVDDKIIVSQNYDNKSGLSIGDEIIKFDGEDINIILERLSASYYCANNEYNLMKAGAMLRAGEKNSEILITVKDSTGHTKDIKLLRNTLLNNIYEPRPPVISTSDSNTLYIDMTAMTDNQMKDYLKNLDNFDKFIFDLRGDSKMSEHILSLFTNQPLNTVNWEIPTYTFPDKLNKSKEIIAGEILPKSKLLNKALLFLINERTTGYSEIIAKIVKDNNLGKLLGNPSMGNASETFTVRLAGGFAISLSGMICIDTNDKMIFNNPILPDIYTKESMDNVKANKDVIIQTALKFVKE